MCLFVDGYVDFSGSSPEYDYAVNAGLGFEIADVLTDLLHHVPAVLAGLYVVAVETLCVVVVESGGHGHDFLELVLYGVDVFFFENLTLDGRFVGIFGINVPCAEYDVVKFCDRYDVAVFEIFLSAPSPTRILSYCVIEPTGFARPLRAISTPVMKVELTAPRPTTITPSLPSAFFTLLILLLND